MNEVLELNYSQDEISNIIGKKGKKIKDVENALKIKAKIHDSKIIIKKYQNGLNDFELVNIFDALALGFKAKQALLLTNPEYMFEKISLKLKIRPSRRKIIKARIIGTKGKTRRLIEELTGCFMAISKNFIGLIGKHESIAIAKKAIEKLIRGQKHSAVYSWLQRESELIEERAELTEKQLKELE